MRYRHPKLDEATWQGVATPVTHGQTFPALSRDVSEYHLLPSLHQTLTIAHMVHDSSYRLFRIMRGKSSYPSPIFESRGLFFEKFNFFIFMKHLRVYLFVIFILCLCSCFTYLYILRRVHVIYLWILKYNAIYWLILPKRVLVH